MTPRDIFTMFLRTSYGLSPGMADEATHFAIDLFELDSNGKLPIEWEILNEYSVKGMLLANYWLPKIANMNSLYHQRVLTMLSNKTGISFSDLNQRLQTLIRVEVRKLMVADLLSGNVNITVETK